MKTLLYNTDINEPITKIREGVYTVDGVQPTLPANIVELEVQETELPDFDTVKQYVTSEFQRNGNYWQRVWTIYNKTDEEISTYLNGVADSHASGIRYDLLRKQADEAYTVRLTELSALDDTAALDVASEYEPFVIGKAYQQNERFYYPVDQKLYKVLQAHTSEAQWLPNEAVSLYVAVTPAGQIAEWVQPLGAQDAYQVGDKVTHNGFTWESTVANNVWEPGVYGWVII